MIWSDRARVDLKRIWTFTRRRWGAEQAERYVAGLKTAAADVVADGLRSKSAEFVSPGLRKARYVRHFIYFRRDGDGIRVSRVLHDQQDETAHLL